MLKLLSGGAEVKKNKNTKENWFMCVSSRLEKEKKMFLFGANLISLKWNYPDFYSNLNFDKIAELKGKFLRF